MPKPSIVIVGAGFAGYQAARELSHRFSKIARIVLVNSTDYSLYHPLLPEVAAGILDPRRIAVSLSETLPGVRLVLGVVDGIDPGKRRVHYVDPEGSNGVIAYDRLIVTVGSVNKVLPVPGIPEQSHGFRSIPEALYLRDHLIRQVELAANTTDPSAREARLTFVVVGAGYTGTEVTAAGQMFTSILAKRHSSLRDQPTRWVLLNLAPRVLPEMRPRLSMTAERVLRRRGVDLRLGTTVREAESDAVVLTDGERVPTRTIVWTVGVRPDPLVDVLGLPTAAGRIRVDEYLAVPDHPEIFVCGDAGAVPDLTRPGEITPMTGQHAQRQGKTVARNVAASLGHGRPKPYKHRNLGFVIDLAGMKAAADPFGIPISGVMAKAVTRAHHLTAIPGNRIRIIADWVLDAMLPRQAVQFGLVRSASVPLDTADPEIPRFPLVTPNLAAHSQSASKDGGAR
jgi:NADH dehydrogenase